MDVENTKDRRLIFICMKNILTPEEKKYLNMVCNYLKSYGMRNGTINIELDNEQQDVSEETIDWQYITHFDYNSRADIPEGLFPILKKIWSFAVDNNLFEFPDDIEYVNYQYIEIEIDGLSKDISVKHYYTFYDQSLPQSQLFDSKEDKEMFDGWMDNELKDTEVPESGYLTIRYNGSGDSGYIDSVFDETGDPVPAEIEDWCYRELESNHGGWEINEGSEGYFLFNFNDSTISLEHTANVEENVGNTLYEENFSL